MVTVVDAVHFLEQFRGETSLLELDMAISEEDERGLADLFVDQVEFADVILVNKADCVSAELLQETVDAVKSLNPGAVVLPCVRGKVPLDQLLGTRRFNMEQAMQSAAWVRELQVEHTPETEEYGIGNFVFRDRRPFHPQRFWDFIHQDWPGLLRSKGYFWLASRPHIVAVWSQAGGLAEYRAAGYWWAAAPKADWPGDVESVAWIESKMEEPWGDRRQELVFIGQQLPREEMVAQLKAALLTPEELAMGMGLWPKLLTDPFPAWEEENELV